MSRQNEDIRTRLLDGGDPERLEAELGAAISADPELMEDLELTPFIAALDGHKEATDGLGPDAIQTRWHAIARGLDGDVEQPLSPAGSKPNWRQLLGALPAGRWAFGGAFVALLALGAAYLLSPRTVAELVYVADEALIGAATPEQIEQGVHKHGLQAGSNIETTDGGGIVRYTDQVEVLLSGATAVRLVGRRGFELASGAAWIEVARGKGNFVITTPEALVRVTGTQFGVARSAGVTRVTVDEGSVEVQPRTGSRESVRLGAGDAGASFGPLSRTVTPPPRTGRTRL